MTETATKIGYGLLGGTVVAIMHILVQVVFAGAEPDDPATPPAHPHGQCWEPPKEAERWANPTLYPTQSMPVVCANRAFNNKNVFPRSHRCLRLVPCGWDPK